MTVLESGGSDAMVLTLIGFATTYFLIGVTLVVDAIRRLSRTRKVKEPALKISASSGCEKSQASAF